MHASSRENMERCYDRFLAARLPAPGRQFSVVEVGSGEFNGSYRGIFPGDRYTYIGCDRTAGPGVDIVLDDPYRLPLGDGEIDVVVSGQMLEHCEFFWLSFAEMLRILKPDGYLFLIVPSAGPIHNYPVDCYRFYPDALKALAKYSGCRLVDLQHDDRGPWNDLIGVFRPAAAPVPSADEIAANVDAAQAAWRGRLTDTGMIDRAQFDAPPEADVTKGAASYLATLGQLHRALNPRLYLEIGIRHGRSLALATGAAVAVDPAPEPVVPVPPRATIHRQTSDCFFERGAAALDGGVDLAFIDGMHRVEFVIRDLINVERHARPCLVAAIDDVFPSHPIQAERNRRSRVWCGDVWKIAYVLARYRPDLLLLRLDAEPAGLLLVAGFDPGNKILREQYNPIVREMTETLPPGVPDPVLARHGALAPDDPRIQGLLDLLAGLSAANANHGTVRTLLQGWRTQNRL